MLLYAMRERRLRESKDSQQGIADPRFCGFPPYRNPNLIRPLSTDSMKAQGRQEAKHTTRDLFCDFKETDMLCVRAARQHVKAPLGSYNLTFSCEPHQGRSMYPKLIEVAGAKKCAPSQDSQNLFLLSHNSPLNCY